MWRFLAIIDGIAGKNLTILFQLKLDRFPATKRTLHRSTWQSLPHQRGATVQSEH